MIVKALLAFAGLRATPDLHTFTPAMHSDDVHKAFNLRTALLAGHARVLRLQRVADRAAAAGNTAAVARTAAKQSEVRAAIDELARRLG